MNIRKHENFYTSNRVYQSFAACMNDDITLYGLNA